MATIGRMEYPELTLTQAVEITEKVGRQNVKTIVGLAQVMGLKSINSGYFYHQVSALTKYFGVVNRTRESISLTPLGERIAHKLTDADRRLALAEAASRVRLLPALYEALGQSYHEADFKTKLRDVTGASLPEIEKAAAFVERLYHDAIPYIAQVPAQGLTSQPARESAEEHPGSGGRPPKYNLGSLLGISESDMDRAIDSEFRTYKTTGIALVVKRDLKSLREAEMMLRAWRELQEEHEKAARPKRTEPKGGDGSDGP